MPVIEDLNIETISYHTSASGIRKNIQCSASASHIQRGRRPSWIWDADALYFPYFQERECDNIIYLQANLARGIEYTGRR